MHIDERGNHRQIAGGPAIGAAQRNQTAGRRNKKNGSAVAGCRLGRNRHAPICRKSGNMMKLLRRSTAIFTVLLFAVSTFSILPAEARGSHHAYSQRASPDEGDLQTHGRYKNIDGQSVHSPAKSKTGAAPAGASAQCGDGTFSFSKHARGTCSHHGGVANWQ